MENTVPCLAYSKQRDGDGDTNHIGRDTDKFSPPPTVPQHVRFLRPLIEAQRVHSRYRAHEAFLSNELRQIEFLYGVTIHRFWNSRLRRLEFELDSFDRLKAAVLLGEDLEMEAA